MHNPTAPISLSVAEQNDLARRLGSRGLLEQRQRLQKWEIHTGCQSSPGEWRWGQLRFQLFRMALRLLGLYQRGRKNFFDLRVVRMDLPVAGLPPRLEGLSVLHLSDTHYDLEPAIMDRLGEVVAKLEYDFCVHTGDFLNTCAMNPAECRSVHRGLRKHLSCDPWCVLGNHDPIEMVPILESIGYRFLLNESTVLELRNTPVYLSGIDEGRFFGTADLEKAGRAGGPPEALPILLSHRPEFYAAAARHGFRLMLSGHTHGGQVCLPGGRILTGDFRCPHPMVAGRWEYGGLSGYTTRGVGGCRLPVRFFCPPEVALLRLVSRK